MTKPCRYSGTIAFRTQYPVYVYEGDRLDNESRVLLSKSGDTSLYVLHMDNKYLLVDHPQDEVFNPIIIDDIRKPFKIERFT